MLTYKVGIYDKIHHPDSTLYFPQLLRPFGALSQGWRCAPATFEVLGLYLDRTGGRNHLFPYWSGGGPDS